MLPHPPLIVAIQDPPSRRSVLPTISGFISFVPPPPGRPRVAIYVSRALNQHLSCSTIFYKMSEKLCLDVFSPQGLFGSPHRSLRVTSVYLLRTNRPPYRSISPERVFSVLSYPHLVLGDFNLHHPLADPCRSLSERQFIISTGYFDAALMFHTTLSTLPGFTLGSGLTPLRDPPFWTWPLRIPPSPPSSPHGTPPSPPLVRTMFHV